MPVPAPTLPSATSSPRASSAPSTSRPPPCASRPCRRRRTPRRRAARCRRVRGPRRAPLRGGRCRRRASRIDRRACPSSRARRSRSCPSARPCRSPSPCPPGTSSEGGATTVTPVRCPLSACEWPTRTPGTSVIALRGPGRGVPPGPRCRASAQPSLLRGSALAACWRLGRRLRVMQQAGRELVAARPPASGPGRRCRTARSASGSAGGSGSRGGTRSGRAARP